MSSDWPILKKVALQVAEGMLHGCNSGGVRHEIRPIRMRYFSVVFALENITFGR